MRIRDTHIRPFLFLSLLLVGLINACTDYQHPDFEPMLIGAPNDEGLAIYLNTDSVLRAAESIKPVKRRLDSLLTWTDRINAFNGEIAYEYAEAANLLAIEYGKDFSRAIALYYKALLKGRWQTVGEGINIAISEAKISKNLINASNNLPWEIRINSLLGNLYFRNRRFKKSQIDSAKHYLALQESLLERAQLSEKEIAYFYGYYFKDLALINEDAGAIDKAIASHQASIQAFEKSEDETVLGIAWRALGIFYSDQMANDVEVYFRKSIEAFQKGIEIIEKSNNTTLLAETYYFLSASYFNYFYETDDLDAYHKSLDLARKSLSLGPKNVFLIYEMIALNYDQYLYEPNQMPPQSWDSRGDSALIYYKRSVDESIKEGAFSIMQLGVEYINDLCDHKRRLTGLDCSEVLGVERYSDFLSQSYMALNVKDIESTILAEEKESMENIARAEKQNLNRLSNNRLMWGGALLISGLIFSIILLTVQKKRLLSRMQTLRSQINPHFMNNSLNAIESLIIQDKKKEASKYLVHFSRLTRKMLDSSRKPMTSLKDELDTLKHFLALEQLRFRDKFSYTIEISPEIDTGQVQFPAVLLQPYVENAILHGIKPLEGKGHLSIKIEKLGKTLKVSIQDNGIGRTASAAIKAQSNRSEKRISHAMKINEERIQMLKKNKKTKVEIIDLYDEYQNSKGTLVSIQLPFKTIKT